MSRFLPLCSLLLWFGFGSMGRVAAVTQAQTGPDQVSLTCQRGESQEYASYDMRISVERAGAPCSADEEAEDEQRVREHISLVLHAVHVVVEGTHNAVISSCPYEPDGAEDAGVVDAEDGPDGRDRHLQLSTWVYSGGGGCFFCSGDDSDSGSDDRRRRLDSFATYRSSEGGFWGRPTGGHHNVQTVFHQFEAELPHLLAGVFGQSQCFPINGLPVILMTELEGVSDPCATY